jgi:putative hydrolase of the HAD superfamily
MPYHQAFVSCCNVSNVHLVDAVNALADEFMKPPIFTCVLPGAVDALRALTELGLTVAIVTNSGGYAREMLEAIGVCQVGPGSLPSVAAVFDSAIIGYEKPDPRIFEHAMDQLGVSAEECVHIGDTPAADVDGAVAAGIRPILIDPLDVYSDVPHTRVRALADVLAVLTSP